MDLLPLELNVKIFGLLDLGDLMTLRLVCKKFEWIVREVKIREVIAKKDFSIFDGEVWFRTSDLKDASAIFSSNFLLPRSSPLGGPFNVRFLRRLSIESLNDAKGLKVEDLNRFQYLEHLEIGFDRQPRKKSVWSRFDKKSQKRNFPIPSLCLPNLKVLRIISFYNQKGIKIDAPRLEALELPELFKYYEARKDYAAQNDLTRLEDDRFISNLYMFLRMTDNEQDYLNDMGCLQFKHPESIKCLSVFHLTNYSKNPNFIEKFRNVEHLLVSDRELFDKVSDLASIVPKFEKLKVIDLCNGTLSRGSLSEVTHLVERVTALQRPELKVYYLGVRVTNNPTYIPDFNFYQQAFEREGENLFLNQVEYQIAMSLKNYSLLVDRIDAFVFLLRYNELVEKLLKMRSNQEIADKEEVDEGDESVLYSLFPVDFFDRFPRIIGITTERIAYEDHFTHLVKSCKNLRCLCLMNSELSQAFFDQLPAISSLGSLEIIEGKKLNVDFLSRMYHLSRCGTNQELNSQIVLKLTKTRNFQKMVFVIRNKFVLIHRDGAKYHLMIDSVENVVNSGWLNEYVVDFESLSDHLSKMEMAGPGTIALQSFQKFWSKIQK